MKERREKLKEVTNKARNMSSKKRQKIDLEVEKGEVVSDSEISILDNVVNTDPEEYFFTDLLLGIDDIIELNE